MGHDRQNRGMGVGTAMAAEVMWCVRQIFDLLFHKSLSVQHIDQCVDTLFRKSMMWYILRKIPDVCKDEKKKGDD